jgi:hypothetical protein
MEQSHEVFGFPDVPPIYEGIERMLKRRPELVELAATFEEQGVTWAMYSGEQVLALRPPSYNPDSLERAAPLALLRTLGEFYDSGVQGARPVDADIIVADADLPKIQALFPDCQPTVLAANAPFVNHEDPLRQAVYLFRVGPFEIKVGSDGLLGDFRLSELVAGNIVEYNIIDYEVGGVRIPFINPVDTLLVKLGLFRPHDTGDIADLLTSPYLSIDPNYLVRRATEMGIAEQVRDRLQALDLWPSHDLRLTCAFEDSRHNNWTLDAETVASYPSLVHIYEAEQDEAAAATLGEMKLLVRSMIPAWVRNNLDPEVRELSERTVHACATALITERYHYGDGQALGAHFAKDPANHLPTTYHNHLGTLFAMFGAAMYMDTHAQWAHQSLPSADSPYDDPHIYLETLLAAAFDDIYFEGTRNQDEARSAQITSDYLHAKGFGPETALRVAQTVDASVWDETTGAVQANPANAMHRAATVGDVIHLGTIWGALQAFRLAPEDLHKSNSPAAGQFQQVLQRSLKALQETGQPLPRTIPELFRHIDDSPELTRAVAEFFINNEPFMVHQHRFVDGRFEQAIRSGKIANGRFQRTLGQRMLLPEGHPAKLSVSTAAAVALRFAYNDDHGPIAIPLRLQPTYQVLLRFSREMLNGTAYARQ